MQSSEQTCHCSDCQLSWMSVSFVVGFDLIASLPPTTAGDGDSSVCFWLPAGVSPPAKGTSIFPYFLPFCLSPCLQGARPSSAALGSCGTKTNFMLGPVYRTGFLAFSWEKDSRVDFSEMPAFNEA